MARRRLKLTREEVQRDIPYGLICETLYGASWGTGRLKRKFQQEFDEYEKRDIYRLRRKAREWYLEVGVPDTVIMARSTYDLWQRLGRLCMEV